MCGLRSDEPWRWVLAGALVAAAAAPLGWTPLPLEARRVVHALLVVTAGYVLTGAMEERLSSARWSQDLRRAGLVRLLLRLLVYMVVIAVALNALDVTKMSNIAFGGAMVTVIIGLAGQTLFGNVLSGIVLVVWRPFEIGDDISVVSSLMPLLPTTYPHETLPYSTRLRIRDVNLLHTVATAEDGQHVRVPNGVMLQAVVRNHTNSGPQRLHVMAEAEAAIDPVNLWERLQTLGGEVNAGESVVGTPVVRLLSITAAGTTFEVELWIASAHDSEDVRSHVLVAVAGMLRELREARRAAE